MKTPAFNTARPRPCIVAENELFYVAVRDPNCAAIFFEDLTSEEFRDPRARSLFDAFKPVFEKHRTLNNPALIVAELDALGTLAGVGGAPSIFALFEDTAEGGLHG